ncbi:uncharacterized protein LOC105843374 isoform X1 [Hydra vulgaris]|uniref:uncharacterized protein LOC105843374 isoform X1 n=1 Tax=Hydra vulgaris TaxID=6087 RepID=UPI001F5FF07F|nr:uncharacterized protein LOC105843374 isoform X1 [Hydra vulgaris]
MEFDFDEDIFETKLKNSTIKEEQYFPKTCTPEWFVNSVLNEKSVDYYHQIMFEADLLYYKRDYNSALEKYFKRIEYLTVKNGALLCATLGSIIRCYLKLNQPDLAEHYIPKLLNGSFNPSDCSTYELAYNVYRKNEKYIESLSCIVQALDINPRNAFYWIYLYELLECIKIHLNLEKICVNSEEFIITDQLFQDVIQFAKFSLNDIYEKLEIPPHIQSILQKIKNYEKNEIREANNLKVKTEHNTLRFRYNKLIDLCCHGEQTRGEFFKKWFFGSLS